MRGIEQTCGNLSVDVLSLPGAAANQDHRDDGIGNVCVTASSPNLIYGQILVDNVAGTDRLVHDVFVHHPDEPILMLLVFQMLVAYQAFSRDTALPLSVGSTGFTLTNTIVLDEGPSESRSSQMASIMQPGSRGNRTTTTPLPPRQRLYITTSRLLAVVQLNNRSPQ